ncbi:arginyl-tRNA--protein transferase 1 isoform X1 [Thalassophryne amazonica]|uniref:arginyl-tRNA--protein transferase 1 isoform X1 n=1 Tax=Thalassophryne amazonica TaxID=390379 RepID=UPI001470EEDE|nr:arginyl-tRNA--protein transferase 1 isoform X1 [Thalassophryne amazonica]
MAGKSYSIVEYFGGDGGHRCGYCKNEEGNFSHGMWSHTLSVQDYQDLIDRGWRRSGKYVYKPTMNKTCCPQYAIRCHALKFQPTKSHKKILKMMSKFISKGELHKEQTNVEVMDSVCEDTVPQEPNNAVPSDLKCSAVTDIQEYAGDVLPLDPASPRIDASVPGDRTAKAPKPGIGADPNRPPCRKAKHLRKQRHLQKGQMKSHVVGKSNFVTATSPTSTKPVQSKILEDFINESLPEDPRHCLEVRLVRSNPPSPQFKASFDASYQVYKLYQMTIHKDPPEKPSESQFRRFLCDSPLEAECPSDGPEVGYGSFHQQYWLDGRIVAVGVIDILPTSVSSVYLYYHPDFASLTLGSYSALREIAFTRQLQKQSPKLSFYYLGFYIHSCPKMRYKGQFRPSDLLCPETYIWMPIECCTPILDHSHYGRFNQDPDAGDACALKDVGRVLVLHRRTVMPYAVYCRKRHNSSDDSQVQEYAGLVGQDCAERMLLYRS